LSFLATALVVANDDDAVFQSCGGTIDEVSKWSERKAEQQ
jgi:hypothetical protein